ncbi:alpha/beta hydrolase [Candidatus Enterococcus murrayae]|uniref:Tributyrin esterase n=1 Tax=Candidatus Enterococcus murrayae TaxID=2815321 RepID=A0ABS3HN57_9ENTE|nr:alpha/beta hydrolase-fold protein [Enterococcus sp. MJM16]MBO0454897.1 hypothetical protein [Enterococcus sp. MJM16]
MGILTISFYSLTLQRAADFILVTPKYVDRPLQHLKPIYLLHGGGDDHTKWVRRTPLERYATEQNVFFVLPEGGLNYYRNVKGKEPCQNHIFKELPLFLETQFGVKNHQKILAGLSMGGYGACREGLLHPKEYIAIGSFSGDLNILDSMRNQEQQTKVWNQRRYEFVFGTFEMFERSDRNLANLLETTRSVPETFYYLTCGTEDAFFHSNQWFNQQAKNRLELQFESWAGGHDWFFWNESLQRFLTLLKAAGKLEVV